MCRTSAFLGDGFRRIEQGLVRLDFLLQEVPIATTRMVSDGTKDNEAALLVKGQSLKTIRIQVDADAPASLAFLLNFLQ